MEQFYEDEIESRGETPASGKGKGSAFEQQWTIPLKEVGHSFRNFLL